MSEPKTQCTRCGVTILVTTSKRTNGLCAPCGFKAPSDFVIPKAVQTRLQEVDLDPDKLRDVANHDPTFLDRLIENEETRIRKLRELTPKLRAFERECREAAPLPDPAHLSTRDLGMLGLLEREFKSQTFDFSAPRAQSQSIPIFVMPLFAIPAAINCWPGCTKDVVFLTDSEFTRMDAKMGKSANASASFVVAYLYGKYWWRIVDSPDDVKRKIGDRSWWGAPPVTSRPGEELWVLDVGWVGGPLMGSGHSDAWAWNGKTARHITSLEFWIS